MKGGRAEGTGAAAAIMVLACLARRMVTAAFVATTVMGIAATVVAPAIAAESLAEVVVEARRRSEPLRELPLAADVLDRRSIESAGIVDLYGVAAHAPGLYFESMWGGFGAAPVMRGQSQPTFGGDNVGVFVDGVYQANRVGMDVEPLDLERIEVVRGPQSALFGHSSFAGALHYVPRAPAATPEHGVVLEHDDVDSRAAQAHASGALAGGRLLARIALGWRETGGTERNAADRNELLGGFERRSAALAVTTADESPWRVALSARLQSQRTAPPPTAVLDYRAYNCGARDPQLGTWSYFCGAVPMATQFALSPGLPDSDGEARQARLRVAGSFGGVALESDTTWYRGWSRIVRDFDGTASGESFGVCDERLGCPTPSGPARPVTRLVAVNSIFRQAPVAEELGQELRLRGDRGALGWMLGMTAFRTREIASTALGFSRGDLQSFERLTALLPATPQLAGPLSNANRALVADPAHEALDFLRTQSERRTLAVFGALDWRPLDNLRLRVEARANRERLDVDSRTANFAPGFGRAIGTLRFDDVTPRFSADLRSASRWLWYVSAAKGARSGGVNAVPGLSADEQRFAPEFNWTYELGARFAGDEALWASATLFWIDWADTQITGFSNSRGVTALITRNTAGIATGGVELALDARPLPQLRAQASLAWTDARYRAGSEDPGSGTFCGLTATSAVSSLCTLGATRFPGAAGPVLVPWIEGNVTQRAPRLQWALALAWEAAVPAASWRPFVRVDLSHQSDAFDRSINGARFGERTLLDLRAGLRRAPWEIEAWARNLGDERYVRAMATRLPQFYPTTPRPQDLVYGERRRIGITLRYRR